MCNEENLKNFIRNANIVIHENMMAPVWLFGGVAKCSTEYCYNNLSDVVEGLVNNNHKNFSLYKLDDENKRIRFAAW